MGSDPLYHKYAGQRPEQVGPGVREGGSGHPCTHPRGSHPGEPAHMALRHRAALAVQWGTWGPVLALALL